MSVVRILSSWESSSAGIRDSRSGGNSRSVNSSTSGIEADFLQRESSVGTVMNVITKSSLRRMGWRTREFMKRTRPLLLRSRKSVSVER